MDQHHKHILIGNLKIIRDYKLRNVYTMGPKYIKDEKLKSQVTHIARLNESNETWFTKHDYEKSLIQ